MPITKQFEGYGSYWVIMHVRLDEPARYMWVDAALYVDKQAYDEKCTPTQTMTFELSGELYPMPEEFALGNLEDVASRKLLTLPVFEGGVIAG